MRHIVMWNVGGISAETKKQNIQLLKDSFEKLKGQIPGMLCLEIGIDESGVDYACDVLLYSEFESSEALAAYSTHPAHLRAKAAVGDIRTAKHQVDYQIPQDN